jgi:predicted TPR repeat methyltransferase
MNDPDDNTPGTVDNEELAEAYNHALALEKAGRRDAAVAAWRKVLEIDPADHGGAAIRLAALGAAPPPKRMPDAYVETLFDQHATAFDDILVDQLGYAVPLMLAAALRAHAPGPYDRGLDLGCGTGLTGAALDGMVTTMIGLDISEEMVALAEERDCYDGLYVAEAEDFLESIGDEEAPFDLIAATDVLPYIGDVSRLFAGMAVMATDRAVIGFSTESFEGEDEGGYRVLPSHRYAHDPAYVEAELRAAGFEPIHREEIVVRMEKNEPAPGHLFLARKV